MRRLPVEALSVLYLLGYAPYIVVTRWLATTPSAQLGRPLTGLEMLPVTMIVSGLFTYGFVWANGWWKDAHQLRLGPLSIPTFTGWTFVSGICTALVLFTVPLSFTFPGVSIPFIQVLMRGDVLIVAPLVDLVTGRKVRWYSWAALALAAAGIGVSLEGQKAFHLPPLAILTVVLYTVGYFGRLFVMTRIAKSGEARRVNAYFVEEKVVGIPAATLFLALIAWLGLGAQKHALSFGFVDIWRSDQLGWLILLSALLFVVSVISALILLDPRENSFCVPMERSASILATLAAAFWLAWQFHQPAPGALELTGAALLVAAISLLSLAPRWAAPAALTPQPEA